MGGSTGYNTSTQTSRPWGPQRKPIKEGIQAAHQLWKQGHGEYYPGSTVAGFSPEQKEGMNMAAGFARDGGMSEGYMKDVLSGKYLQNPFSDRVFEDVQSRVMPAVNSAAMSRGRAGSALATGVAAREMTNAYSPYGAQQYQQGLDRMGQAATMLPQMQFNRANAMYDVGAKKQGLAQQELDDSVNRWQYYQDLPWNQLSQYMNMVSGNYGNQTTSMSPYHRPGLGGILGGGLMALLGLGG